MIDYEVLEWCKMSPVERFVESQKLWEVFETPQNVPRETSCTILRLRNQSFFFQPHSSVDSTDKNAFCGISTFPMDFILFLPSFCFSKSFRFLVISPPS